MDWMHVRTNEMSPHVERNRYFLVFLLGCSTPLLPLPPQKCTGIDAAPEKEHPEIQMLRHPKHVHRPHHDGPSEEGPASSVIETLGPCLVSTGGRRSLRPLGRPHSKSKAHLTPRTDWDEPLSANERCSRGEETTQIQRSKEGLPFLQESGAKKWCRSLLVKQNKKWMMGFELSQE